MKDIKLDQIAKFKKNYESDYQNKIIENAIRNNGIDAVCLNQDAIQRNPEIFNLELPQAKPYNQEKTGRCWCFAGINMIKYDIAKNMNVKDSDLELSVTYLTFFDKLEKSNKVYENIIATGLYDYKLLNEEGIMNFGEGGLNIYFRELIKKYGIIPSNYMRESHDSNESNKLILIMQEKIKKDIKKILTLKKENKDIDEIRKLKENMLEENYVILSKVLGQPPTEFDLEFRDKDNKFISTKNMTPLKFKEMYLKIDLDDYVTVCNIPRYNREDYKKYIRKYDGSIFDCTKNEYINIPIKDLEKIVLKQLKDGLPVSFICPTSKMWNRKDWILDSQMYNYQDVLNVLPMNKIEEFNFYDIEPNHAMTFVGVHIVDNKPLRWKVENSWGNKDSKQYIVMNNTYFDDYVIEISVLKKYLTPKMLKAFEQEPIEIDVKEW